MMNPFASKLSPSLTLFFPPHCGGKVIALKKMKPTLCFQGLAELGAQAWSMRFRLSLSVFMCCDAEDGPERFCVW